MGPQKLPQQAVYLHRALISFAGALLAFSACTTLQTVDHDRYRAPQKGVYLTPPSAKPFQVIGRVKTRVNWPTLLSPDYDENALCKNYWNKGLQDLMILSKKNGGDGILEPRSVTFLVDGNSEVHKTPECSDDGEEGQILMTATAFRWLKPSERPVAVTVPALPQAQAPPMLEPVEPVPAASVAPKEAAAIQAFPPPAVKRNRGTAGPARPNSAIFPD